MRWRDQIALTLPSLILRIALAITFLWAGTAKIAGTTTVSGDAAARLANLGVPFLPDDPPPPSDRAAPVNPPPEDPEATEPQPPQSETPERDDEPLDDNPATDAADPGNDAQTERPLALAGQARVIRVAQTTESPKVGSDFPEPQRVRRVHTIALLLDMGVNPGLTADSTPRTPLLPSWVGRGRVPVYLAWAAAITELLAGVLLLVGLLTRLGALATLGVMLVAMWTTTIGPAALQSSDAILGFIPNAADPWAPESYMTLLWQLALACVSLSVVLLGPGPLSIDRLVFRPKRDPYASAEPARAPARDAPDGAPDPNP